MGKQKAGVSYNEALKLHSRSHENQSGRVFSLTFLSSLVVLGYFHLSGNLNRGSPVRDQNLL
jgi:hypothetical protein